MVTDADGYVGRILKRNIDWRALSLALITSILLISSLALIGFYTNVVFIDNTGGLKKWSETIATSEEGSFFFISRSDMIYIFLIILIISTMVFYWIFKVLNRKKK